MIALGADEFADRRTVVPVLVGETRGENNERREIPPPTVDQLPESINGLAWLQARRLRKGSHADDVDSLVAFIGQWVPSKWTQPVWPEPPQPKRRPVAEAVLAVLTAALLVGPALLLAGSEPTPRGEVPLLLLVAFGSTLFMVAPALASGLAFALLGRLLPVEQELQRTPIPTYHRRFAVPAATMVAASQIVMLVALDTNDGVLFVCMTILVASTAYIGVVMIRSERDDKDAKANWPNPLPESVPPVPARRALVRLRKRIASWPEQPSALQRKQAAWMLEHLGEAADRVERDAGRSRRAWLTQDHPAVAVAAALWAAATVGVAVASVLPNLVSGTGNPRLALGPALVLALVVGFGGATLEFVFRTRRQQRAGLVKELREGVAELGTHPRLARP